LALSVWVGPATRRFMDIYSTTSLVATTAYTILLIVAFIRRHRTGEQMKWLTLFLIISAAWELSRLLMVDVPYYLVYVPSKILLVGTLVLGLTTAVYVDWPYRNRWLLLGTIAIGLTFVVDALPPRIIFIPDLPALRVPGSVLAHYMAWILLSGYILLKTWYDYRHTRFPWHANRLLYWTIALLLTFSGEALILSNQADLALGGQIVRFIGVIGLAHATFSHRVFDVRTRVQRILAFVVIGLISALPTITAVVILYQFVNQISLNNLIILTVIIVTIGFLIYQPIHNAVSRVVHRYLIGESVTTNQLLRNYSQAVSRALDIQQLSLMIMGTLSELLHISRGALILFTPTQDGHRLEAIPAMGQIERRTISLPTDSLFIKTLQQENQPLLQYEIDFNPIFAGMSSEERAWLQEMFMEVYVPITAGETLDGLIAIGPKESSIPYRPEELDTVQTLADQTVVALQNARLYSELGEQNEKIRHLNVDLTSQNERLEIMDRVKSDFITIASHELRTPLTQVKGYTDILASMNEDESLTPEQTKEIIGHINRASLQLETLITAMLDASQLDAEGIYLTYVQTTLETILRLAVEPLAQAMKDRRIAFELEGVRDLPVMEADFKRLVQAFTNIIGNAVKYTPDNGRIVVKAEVQPSMNEDVPFVEIVVQDSGIGIDPQYHELIFEKFFRVGSTQLHSTGSTKFKGAGPGLGLPIAKGVIEAHAGRIWVESEEENEERLPGTRVHIILPLRPPASHRPDGENGRSAQQVQAERPSYLVG
jgi:signal transduction histidine kinase